MKNKTKKFIPVHNFEWRAIVCLFISTSISIKDATVILWQYEKRFGSLHFFSER